jgi:hypothetical protein
VIVIQQGVIGHWADTQRSWQQGILAQKTKEGGRDAMNTIIRRGFRRREVVLAWVPIGLATLPFTAAAIDPPSTTLANGARVAIVDDTLEIEGTPEDDLIQIGATRHPDTVRVTVDGEDRGHHGPIVRIEIHAGAGDDLVRGRARRAAGADQRRSGR